MPRRQAVTAVRADGDGELKRLPATHNCRHPFIPHSAPGGAHREEHSGEPLVVAWVTKCFLWSDAARPAPHHAESGAVFFQMPPAAKLPRRAPGHCERGCGTPSARTCHKRSNVPRGNETPPWAASHAHGRGCCPLHAHMASVAGSATSRRCLARSCLRAEGRGGSYSVDDMAVSKLCRRERNAMATTTESK